jgi:hypothetical protein
MTNSAMARRLLRLEENRPQGELEELTWDELKVLCLEVTREILASDESLEPEERERCERSIAEIEADLMRLARKQVSAEYAQHLDYCRSLWAKRGGNKYEPALTAGDGGMGEYQDWDKPRVMERRKALRSHPIVQELIGQVEN